MIAHHWSTTARDKGKRAGNPAKRRAPADNNNREVYAAKAGRRIRWGKGAVKSRLYTNKRTLTNKSNQ